MAQDPYRVLGVAPGATDDEIKRAYRALAKKYHPDVNGSTPDAEAKMKEINEAYATLTKRKTASGGASGGYDPFSGARSYQQSASPELRAARNYAANGYYEQALNVLNSMRDHSAEWHYLCAVANEGLGNHISAIDFAQRACDLEPNNFEYRSFLNRLSTGTRTYADFSRGFGGMPWGRPDACGKLCLAYALCNCCCGRRLCC